MKTNAIEDILYRILNDRYVPIDKRSAGEAQKQLDAIKEAMSHVAAVASGELQVADDDTGGMKYIADYLANGPT